MATRLYVGNLSYSATNADLEELFAQVGNVQSVNIVTDKVSGQSRGFGFVEMSTPEEAQQAIERLNGQELKGRALRIDQARSREDKPDRGGRRGPKPRH